MIHPQYHPSQQGFIQAGIPAMVNPPDALRKALNSQLSTMNLYKEPTTQVFRLDHSFSFLEIQIIFISIFKTIN